jgi:hypothetical protein
MISYGNASLGAARRRSLNIRGDTFYKSEWMESGQAPGLAPTVFLVEQPPNCTLEPHFHTRNQFQLFLAGGGRIGPRELSPVTVHYAGAFTGYGPLVSGSEGIQYFTIRAQFESGFIPAAQAREKMLRGPKRHKDAFVGHPSSGQALHALPEVERRDIIAGEAGLGVELLRLPAQSRCSVSPLAGSAGCFLFVLSGHASVAGVERAPWESAFVPRDDAAQEVSTAGSGAELVVLHIPEESPEYAGSQVVAGGGELKAGRPAAASAQPAA